MPDPVSDDPWNLLSDTDPMLRRLWKRVLGPPDDRRRRGSVFVEYLLLLTIVGIGVIVGLVAVREALINELNDLAQAINAINT